MDRLRRIAPPTGGVTFREDSIEIRSTHPEPAVTESTGSWLLGRAELFAGDVSRGIVGTAEFGLGAAMGPIGIPLDVDGGLRVMQAIVRAFADVSASDAELAKIRKDTEAVTAIGILTVLEKNMAGAITGHQPTWDEMTDAAEKNNRMYNLFRGLKTLSKAPSSKLPTWVSNLKYANAGQNTAQSTELGQGGDATPASKSSKSAPAREKNDRGDSKLAPDPHNQKKTEVGDFPNHIPKPGRDGTILS